MRPRRDVPTAAPLRRAAIARVGAIACALALVACSDGARRANPDLDAPKGLATMESTRGGDRGGAEKAPRPEDEDLAAIALPGTGPWTWQAFAPQQNTAARYAVDVPSLRIDADGIVRYVLRSTTASGLDNLTFEGIDCNRRRWRLYAIVGADGAWRRTRSPWAEWIQGSADRPREQLGRMFFCEKTGLVVASVPTIVTRLRAAAVETRTFDPANR
ncbi:MAG: CNP1-like family protein [Burkholderiales bacterium]|jgi:hypothetical protein|nr:CNP1-like family protein [Burkholderiales bacterium]